MSQATVRLGKEGVLGDETQEIGRCGKDSAGKTGTEY